jgi:hypothetical protein
MKILFSKWIGLACMFAATCFALLLISTTLAMWPLLLKGDFMPRIIVLMVMISPVAQFYFFFRKRYVTTIIVSVMPVLMYLAATVTKFGWPS